MLTTAQLATLKSDIAANFAAQVTAADWPTITAAYNAPSNPVVTIWRADIPTSEIVSGITFSELVALSAVKQFGLQVLMQPGTVDATSANVRAAFSAIFGASTTLTALSALAQRTATRLEALFTTAQVSAVYGYALSANDVQKAMGA